MANRQTYAVGALGVLLGIVVGANSAQRAEMVSYSGINPNNAAIQEMPQLRRAAGIWRQRSDEGTIDPAYSNGEYRITAPRRSTLEDNIQRRLNERLSDTANYSSAPAEITIRGAAQAKQVVPECAGYSSQRYVDCLEALINGDYFSPNYYPIYYNNQ